MHDSRPVVAVVAIIAVTTLASGPLVGAVDLTSEPDRPAFGHGNVTVDSVSFPGNATLTEARFGANGYYLRLPPASIRNEAVSGYPRLSYGIEIPALGYTRSSVHTPESTGEYTLSIERALLDADDVEQRSYEATLSISHTSNHSKREIGSKEITIEVVE